MFFIASLVALLCRFGPSPVSTVTAIESSPPKLLQERSPKGTSHETESGDGINRMHFAAVSDQHYGSMNVERPPLDDDTILDWITHPDLPNLDFVVASFGDWISDSREGSWQNLSFAWQNIANHNANLQALPYFFVVGNHDITNYNFMPFDGNPVLKERLGRAMAGLNENNYAFLYDNVLFICLAQTNTLYHLSHFQKNWVEYLLSRFPDKSTILWAHQALYRTTGQGDDRSSTWNDNDYRVHNDFEWWRNTLTENPQIVMYLHGHTHKAYNSVAFNLHASDWDNHCTFVQVPSNSLDFTHQHGWSYIFTIADNAISIRLWDAETHEYQVDNEVGLPYVRYGHFDVRDTGMEWFSTPKQVLNGQTWTWANRMVASNYILELVGSDEIEQIDNPELDRVHESDETRGATYEAYWYAVRGDKRALNLDTGENDGYIMIPGGNTLELAASPARAKFLEGKVPYNTALAIPGKQYIFSARIKTLSGAGSVDFLASIPRTLTLYDFVWQDQEIAPSLSVTDEYQTYSAYFVVPLDESAWFIQPKIRFHDPLTTYLWDSWSLQMVRGTDVTEDFSVVLNNTTFSVVGELPNHSYAEFTVPRSAMSNDLEFQSVIGGNSVGMVRLVYDRPQLWSDDVSFGIGDSSQTLVYLRDISPFNDRVSIMSFENARAEFVDPELSTEIIRGKAFYYGANEDESIDGYYALDWKKLTRTGLTP